LVAITQPVGRFKELCTPETLPGFTARISRESKGTMEDDKRLNRDLIKLGHTTPLQGLNFVFWVDGITKTLQNQWVRHKTGIGWVFRSSRFVPGAKNRFVYSTYDYIDDPRKVEENLRESEAANKEAIARYERKRKLGATKEDARKVMPVEYNTPCHCYVNSRELRHIFSLRLKKDAEWEIRRLQKILLDLVMEWAPSLFEDFAEIAAKIIP
jgi:thymidylate synthase (FAD)